MGGRRLKFHDLQRILGHYGVVIARTSGSHAIFAKGSASYPIPKRTEVAPCYVAGARRKFGLLPVDGVSDEEFFSR